ncbi:MAG: HAD hydrolase family protein [Candidatus Bathyarchaeia archaeon]
MKPIFISDCEGPISKNDNAFELTAHFMPDGDKVFALVSKYDDVLADVVKKPGYSAGSTLKLILPFLRAFDVNDRLMEEFSAANLTLIQGSKETLRHIRGVAEAFIVSTSYEHYIKALCRAVGFPFENTYCTRVSLNDCRVTAKEKAKLKATAKELAKTPLITIPSRAKSLRDLSSADQATVKRLDEIFWTEIAAMPCGRVYSEVTTVGGEQKAEAIRDAAAKLRASLADVMYVGDSITDVEAFRLVRDSGGLAVSFNGNGYAVRCAEVAVMAHNSTVTAVLADVFCRRGKQAALQLVKNWNLKSLQSSGVDAGLLERFCEAYPSGLPKVQIVTPENMESLSRESSDFRKKVRGEAVGKLG